MFHITGRKTTRGGTRTPFQRPIFVSKDNRASVQVETELQNCKNMLMQMTAQCNQS